MVRLWVVTYLAYGKAVSGALTAALWVQEQPGLVRLVRNVRGYDPDDA